MNAVSENSSTYSEVSSHALSVQGPIFDILVIFSNAALVPCFVEIGESLMKQKPYFNINVTASRMPSMFDRT